MTTIAWDGVSLAADKQMGGRYTAGKIFPLGGGCYLAGAGIYDQIVEVATWVVQGADEDKKPKFEHAEDASDILIVDAEGKAYWLTWPFLRRVELTEKFVAVGSGAEYAIGAMAMGASARRAVQIATRFDPYTGKGMTVVKVKR